MLTKPHDIDVYQTENPDQPAMKFDKEKPRFDLIDPWAMEGLAQVLTFGAQKYAANNWRKGFEYSRVIAALMRHLAAIQRGEDIDPESGLPHIDHLGCCWMFLSNLMKTRKDLDDRWSKADLGNPGRGEVSRLHGSREQSGESRESRLAKAYKVLDKE
jgi:hypothetical protein